MGFYSMEKGDILFVGMDSALQTAVNQVESLSVDPKAFAAGVLSEIGVRQAAHLEVRRGGEAPETPWQIPEAS